MEIKRSLQGEAPPHLLKYVAVFFDMDLMPYEVDWFRAAVVRKVGREHTWFHNHNNEEQDKGQFYYRYPLIQYKSIGNKPMMMLMDQRVEDVYLLFGPGDLSFNIQGDVRRAGIKSITAKEHTVGLVERKQVYELHNWLPLHSRNYQQFQDLDNLRDQIIFLERILAGHLLSFAQGVNWQVGGYVEVNIQEIKLRRRITVKGTKMEAFSLRFSSNMSLPNYLGLGRYAAHGYGWVFRVGSKGV
jgi:hypothetical protein